VKPKGQKGDGYGERGRASGERGTERKEQETREGQQRAQPCFEFAGRSRKTRRKKIQTEKKQNKKEEEPGEVKRKETTATKPPKTRQKEMARQTRLTRQDHDLQTAEGKREEEREANKQGLGESQGCGEK